MNLFRTLLTGLLTASLLLFAMKGYAQKDGESSQTLVYDQVDPFSKSNSIFPKKPKDNWIIGLTIGSPYLQGEVRAEPGIGGGLYIQKALGHTVSLRLQSLYQVHKGLDWRSAELGGNLDYRNYKLSSFDNTLQAVISSNNVHFFKRQASALIYGFVGAGAMVYNTKFDLRDANGQLYDFRDVAAPGTRDNRDATLEKLRNMLDGDYETLSPGDPLAKGFDKNSKLRGSAVVGAGLSMRLSNRIDLNFEYRISWHDDDFLDGYRLTRNNLANSPSDYIHFPNISAAFKFGKNKEPAIWRNPLTNSYLDMYEVKKDMKDIIQDDDDDGVMNRFDLEENTAAGAKVNTHGVTDTSEIAIFRKIGDQLTILSQNITNLGDQTNQQMADLEKRLSDAENFEAIIWYDFNKSKITKTAYPTLLEVVEYMKRHPDSRMMVSGHTDIRATDNYNDRLSTQRVEAAIDMLTGVFGISASRFDSEMLGERDPMVSNLKEDRYPRNDQYHSLNRRVRFRVIK